MKKILSIMGISGILFGCGPPTSTMLSSDHSPTNVVKPAANVNSAVDPNDKPVDDPVSLREESKVSGEFQRAFLKSYDAFKQEEAIPEVKRQLENYKIIFRQKGSYYYVLFYAKSKVGYRNTLGGSTELGVDVMYTVRKSDFAIVQRGFFK